MFAAKLNDIELVENLLHAHIDLKWHFTGGEHKGYSALHLAIIHDNIPMVELLLAHGASIDKSLANGPTALSLAMEKEALTAYKRCIKQCKQEDKQSIIDKELFKAINAKKHDLVEFLLKQGASLTKKENDKNPINIICGNKDWDALRVVARFVQGKKANFENDDADLGQALLHAAKIKDEKLAQEVLHPKIDMTWRFTNDEHKGYTALHFAVANEMYKLIVKLVKNGADPNQCFCGGISAIELAKLNDNEIAKEALEGRYEDIERSRIDRFFDIKAVATPRLDTRIEELTRMRTMR